MVGEESAIGVGEGSEIVVGEGSGTVVDTTPVKNTGSVMSYRGKIKPGLSSETPFDVGDICDKKDGRKGPGQVTGIACISYGQL